MTNETPKDYKGPDYPEIDGLVSKIEGLLESKANEPINLDLMNMKEIDRAKKAFNFLWAQEKEFHMVKEINAEPDKPLEQYLEQRTFASEKEKELFIKIYNFRNRPKEVVVIPFPIKNMKRVVVNGEPLVEFNREGKAYIAESVGKNTDNG